MTDCIEAPGYRTKDGYVNVGGKLAHRVAYEREIGPIPDGLTIDHICNNRACVNVEHLEPCTQAENYRRALARSGGQRAGKTTCINGHVYTPEDQRVGYRRCRICQRAAEARAYAKRKARD